MHGYDFDGSDWMWMTAMMAISVVLIAAAAYAAVRLAQRDR